MTGIPPPVITWSRDGQTLEADGSRVVIVENSLVVADTLVSDSGVYHCSASSSAGLASSSLMVLVLSMLAPSLTDAVVLDDVVFNCSNEQELPTSTPVVWFFDQLSLDPVSDKYVVLQDGSLLVQEVWLDDIGDYVCQVGGQVIFNHTLDLTGKAISTILYFVTCAGSEVYFICRKSDKY